MEEVNSIEQFSKVHDEALEILKKKIIGYEDAFADYGTAGVIVRIGDKIQRMVSVSNRGINLVNTKILREILIDLHNYAAMAIILIDKNNNKISQIQKDQNFDLKIENLC
jgi:hypothetical protein